MSPILGIYASQISGHLVTNNYSSIATTTVGSGGVSSITFSSIPSTYTHLQIRISAQTNRGTYGSDSVGMTFNGVTTGTSYAFHELYGAGSSVAASAVSSTSTPYWDAVGTSASGFFGAAIFDVLDYANNNKNKTTRVLMGTDNNGTVAGFTGIITLGSGLWQNTNAITSITFTPIYGSLFNQYSSFALYGVK